jgi:hypothetical protein
MKKIPARKSLFAMLAIFAVIVALTAPIQVYAAGPSHEPPPPKPPVDDMGKKGEANKPSPVSSSDLPSGTKQEIVSNGTSLPLAAQLSVQALTASSSTTDRLVKFCKSTNPDFYGDCTSYGSIQEAIDATANLQENASGVFYVGLNYPKPQALQGLPIVVDQDAFSKPDAETDLNMLGGYIFSGAGVGTQSSHPTELVQPFIIKNINDASSFSMNNFDFYLWSFVQGDDRGPYQMADIQVTDSDNVSLSNLTITSETVAWGGIVDIENSENINLKDLSIKQNAVGPGIEINRSNDVKLKNITIDQVFMDGISINNSGLPYSTNTRVQQSNPGEWDPSIALDNVKVNLVGNGAGVGIYNSNHIAITNSTFSSYKGDDQDTYPYGAVSAYDSEFLTLNHVSAAGHDRGDGVYMVSTGNISLNDVVATSDTFNAVSFNYGYGPLTLTNSIFSGKGRNGLYVEEYSGDIFINNVKVNMSGHNADPNDIAIHGYGAVFLNVYGDLTIQNSEFNQNAKNGLAVLSGNQVHLNNVTANYNNLSGTFINADSITVRNSSFMYNGGYGLELSGESLLSNVRACHNGLGPVELISGSLFTDNVETLNCQEHGAAAAPQPTTAPESEVASLPWQIFNVYMDPGQNSGMLSCQSGTTFLYLEKQAAPAPDFEWARVELAACLVPSGSVGTFMGLGQDALPGTLPDGSTFLGKAFAFSIMGNSGSQVTPSGAMSVRFTLPGGFQLPAGKKLTVLWFDPDGKKWVALNTFTSGNYATAYSSKTGAFVLVMV